MTAAFSLNVGRARAVSKKWKHVLPRLVPTCIISPEKSDYGIQSCLIVILKQL